MGKKCYYFIIDIVVMVYCEQKVVYDCECGDVWLFDVCIKVVIGIFEYLCF